MRYLYIFFLLSGYAVAQNGDVHNKGEVHVHPNTLVSVKSSFFNEVSGTFINDGEVIFNAHINNDGIWDFTEGLMGYTRLESNRLQRIDGSRPSKFYDLLLNNTTSDHAYELWNELDVYGSVDFYQGIVNTRTTGGTFTFYQDAFALDPSDESYVDGMVNKIGKASFRYPIGHHTYYRPMQTFGASGVDNWFAAIYHYDNSNTYFSHEEKEPGIGQINTTEYWELTDFDIEDNVYISLYLEDRTTGDIFMNPSNEPTIVAWNPNVSKWVDLGGLISEDGNEITTVFKVDLYTAYTLAIKEEIEEDEDFEIFNAVNPNDSRGNEYFKITGLEKYPDNEVTIFNRWGVEVFKTTAYDTKGNVFSGLSDGRVTIKKKKELPEGTYFYVVRRTDPETGKRLTNAGYLYLTR